MIFTRPRRGLVNRMRSGRAGWNGLKLRPGPTRQRQDDGEHAEFQHAGQDVIGHGERAQGRVGILRAGGEAKGLQHG